MLPLPLPLRAPVSVIQLGTVPSDQVQAALAVTVKLPLPPAAAMLALDGEMLHVAHGEAAWLILKVEATPGAVSMPEPLRAAPVLAGAVMVKLPLPVPVAPAETVAQLGALIDQVQVVAAATVPVAVPPAAGKALVLRLMVGTVGQGRPSWVKMNVTDCPMASSWPDPLRAAGSLFAAAVKAMLPLPVPLAAPVAVTKLGMEATLHGHVAAAVTLRVPLAPRLPTLIGLGDTTGADGQLGDAACVALTLALASMKLTLRAAPLWLGAAVKKTSSKPLSGSRCTLPPLTVSQEGSSAASKRQPGAPVTT